MSDDRGENLLDLLLVRAWWRANATVEIAFRPEADAVLIGFVDAPAAHELDHGKFVSAGFDTADPGEEPHLTSLCVVHPTGLPPEDEAWVCALVGEPVWAFARRIAAAGTVSAETSVPAGQIGSLVARWSGLLAESGDDRRVSLASWTGQLELSGAGTRGDVEEPWPIDATRVVDDLVFFREAFGRDPRRAESWPEIQVSLSRSDRVDLLSLEMPVPDLPVPGRHITAVVMQNAGRWDVPLDPKPKTCESPTEFVRGALELPHGSLNAAPMDVKLTVVRRRSGTEPRLRHP
ncbi:hypothetical protein AB0F52_23515 [Amycolatopsis sp. NPDC024027]|uniref:hypothetical protein n=1 Tax=Amycolatopsis sp. NPDC024027 TaxID=3154327 RepID=UPI00340985C2